MQLVNTAPPFQQTGARLSAHAGAIAFGDKTTPANQPGANSPLTGAVSNNNAFTGTRYFALSNNFPNNQYYLFFFQWTVSCCAALRPLVLWAIVQCCIVAQTSHCCVIVSIQAIVASCTHHATPQFAATACTIVSDAIAERAKFEAYILYSFFMAAWVYPIIVHSMWSSSSYIGAFR